MDQIAADSRVQQLVLDASIVCACAGRKKGEFGCNWVVGAFTLSPCDRVTWPCKLSSRHCSVTHDAPSTSITDNFLRRAAALFHLHTDLVSGSVSCGWSRLSSASDLDQPASAAKQTVVLLKPNCELIKSDNCMSLRHSLFCNTVLSSLELRELVNQ